MAVTVKILDQLAPGAAALTAVYTVPALTTATVSTIIACNRAAVADTFRIAVVQGGGAVANEDYIYYDITIAANDSFAATIGVTLGAADEIQVYSTNGNMSFSVFGIEEA